VLSARRIGSIGYWQVVPHQRDGFHLRIPSCYRISTINGRCCRLAIDHHGFCTGCSNADSVISISWDRSKPTKRFPARICRTYEVTVSPETCSMSASPTHSRGRCLRFSHALGNSMASTTGHQFAREQSCSLTHERNAHDLVRVSPVWTATPVPHQASGSKDSIARVQTAARIANILLPCLPVSGRWP